MYPHLYSVRDEELLKTEWFINHIFIIHETTQTCQGVFLNLKGSVARFTIKLHPDMTDINGQI